MQAAALGMVAKRLRARTGLDVAPVLVVEGPTDEDLFGGLCEYGSAQVFAAGPRDLVEQLLVLVEAAPVSDCECVFLTDCDARGKNPALAGAAQLVVTETCDMEADLVKLGVAYRVARRYVVSDEAAVALVEEAIARGTTISIVRRAAHSCSVSMKRDGRQLRLHELADVDGESWIDQTESADSVCAAVAGALGWGPDVEGRVHAAMAQISTEFGATVMGKDVLDALYLLLKVSGQGDVRGWHCDHFHRQVRAEVSHSECDGWEVARRLRSWEAATGHGLLAGA